MAIVSKLTTIGIIAISLLAGFISFYLMSDLPKEQKKKHVEELTTQLINFVLFIWLGKIIVNVKVFISDPLAILAYPSDSNAFYLAVLFSTIVLIYKSKYKQLEAIGFIESFVHVFLIASFLYEFIQLVWNNNTFSFGYLVLLTILLISYFLLRERLTATALISLMLIGWSIGMLGISQYQPFVTVFGYMVAPWFIGIFLIIGLLIIIITSKKRGIS